MAGGMIYVVLIVLVVAIVVLWLVTRGLSKKYALSEADRRRVQESWAQVEEMLDGGKETQAIMEADKLLNFVLERKGVAGENLGERLKNGKSLFKDIDAAWRAHKVRNQIAHDMDIKVASHQARQTLNLFKRTLKDLDAL